MSENWNFQPVFAPYSTTYQKARVGLAVLCRCKDSCVQCLLQKRGPSSSAPNKWSFPGGRLEQPGDLDEDGAVGTRRELMEECGGGVPAGLPELIHIECCKSGKSKQTLYHVYVIDTDCSQRWDSWSPATQNTKDTMIDTSVKHIILRGHQFPSVNGYSWVDMSVLIQECVELNTDQINNSELQHGLVRWVQMYGDHILRTLMARSPKLGHTARRHSNSSNSSSGSAGRPRANSGGRVRRYGGRISASGMLQPPLAPGHFMRPHLQATSMASPFFGMLPASDHFSPPHQLSVNNQLGFNNELGVVTPPSPGDGHMTSLPQGMFCVQPPSSLITPHLQPPSSLITPHLQPPSLITPHLPLPSPSHTNLKDVGTGDEGQHMSCPPPPQAILIPRPQDILPPSPQDILSPSNGAEGTHLTDNQVIIMTTPTVSVAGSPGLQQPYMHKDMVCKHFMVAGQCPFAERCWFVHPLGVPPAPARDGTGPLSSPLHIPAPSHNTPQISHTPSYSPIHGSGHAPSYGGPGQSSICPTQQWGTMEGGWPHLMPGMYRGRPALFPSAHAGLSPGQPFLFLRPPSPGHPNPVPFFSSPYSPQLPTSPQTPSSPQTPFDTILTFALFSEVVVGGAQNGVINEVSHLAVCGDHFYVSVGHTVHAYKVLFGGNRSYQDTSVVQESCTFGHVVTFLHCSRPMPSMLAIGTASGGVYTWDMKRGPRILTTLYEPEEEVGSAVTSLIHFMTSINMAQVMVAGDEGGSLTWYISQPPQKTFSILFTDSKHSPAPVVSLQVLGGLLLSGGRDGRVFLWNMSNHQPQLDTILTMQCSILKDIHVLQNGFLTIGVASTDTTPTLSSGLQSPKDNAMVTDKPPPSGYHSNSTTEEPPTNGCPVESLVNNMSELKVHCNGEGVAYEDKWCASLWENERPPRCSRTVHLGPLVSNAFYHLPNVGTTFLSVGMQDGRVKIYHVPSFNMACELKFSELSGKDCVHLALNLSRDLPLVPMRSPYRDLLLTTVWSGGRVMICQAQKQ